MLKPEHSKIFPPTPSELPDSSSARSELPPHSGENSTPPNPQTVIHATEPASADDAASEDWETIEKPENISPGAQGLESNQEGPKVDSVDADLSVPLSASVDVVGGKKEFTDEKKGEENTSDVGGNAEVKHGLLKDW